MSKDEKKEEDPKDDAGIMESNFDESVETFDELNLKPDLLRGIYGYGFEKPSIKQKKYKLYY